MLLGLTGGIASGKSTVSAIFKDQGFPIVDVDLIAREVVKPKEEAWNKIVEFFGQEILLSDKTIDRKKLGAIIFHDEDQRKILNEITHPIIIDRTMKMAKALSLNYKHVIVDIPLLFESKREELFDLIILVYVNKETQILRLMNRDKISESEAEAKIASQMDLEEKKKKADIIIYNDQSIEETEKQVLQLIHHQLGK